MSVTEEKKAAQCVRAAQTMIASKKVRRINVASGFRSRNPETINGRRHTRYECGRMKAPRTRISALRLDHRVEIDVVGSRITQ